MGTNTLQKKMELLEHSIASFGAYYSFNLTKDTVDGSVLEYIAGIPYSGNEYAKLPENCRFSDYIAYWSHYLSEEDIEEYETFFDREHLLSRYQDGERQLQHTYWTIRVDSKPMLAKQVVLLYEDEDSGDILGITYIVDDTSNFREYEYKKLLKKRNRALRKDMYREQKFLEVISRDYVSIYHVNLLEDTSMLLKYDQEITKGVSSIKLRNPVNYTQRIHKYCGAYVVKNSQKDFLHYMDRNWLLQELEKNQSFVFRYRSIPNELGYQYFEAHAMRADQNTWNGEILLGFRRIDDVISAEQRRQLELEERMEKERNYHEILAALSTSYYAIFRVNLEDDTYEKVSCRPEVSHLYGRCPFASTELSHLCESFIAEEDRERMMHFFNLSTLEERMGENTSIEAECRTFDGNWHRATFIPKRRNQEGRLTHVLYVTKVISEEKNREHKLLSIAETAKAKTEFISQISHDIRTPMNAMFGFLEIAKANMENPERMEYCLNKIQDSCQFLESLADDVLDIARMENGKVKLRPEVIHLQEWLELFWSTMKHSSKNKQHTLEFKCHHILQDSVVVDSLRLKQVYLNLLTNAIKYTPDGGTIRFEIRQEPSETAGMVRIISSISDTGIGMSEAFMQRMFDKFERETDTRINQISGYGLGLPIVKRLVDLMNGTIDVKSILGIGTTICIKLEVPYAEQACTAAKEQALSATDMNAAAALCEGMHLLVAEDNELNREILIALLQLYGITCDCTEDGKACVERFLQERPGTYQAILMDMQMPNMNGLEATACIRSSAAKEAKTIPIYAMTANALREDVDRCLEAGMNLHLAKPIQMEKLLQALALIAVM